MKVKFKITLTLITKDVDTTSQEIKDCLLQVIKDSIVFMDDKIKVINCSKSLIDD